MARFRFFPRLRISTRLTIWFGVGLVALLSLFSVFSYLYFHQSLHRDFDRHLTHEKMQLLPYVEMQDGLPAFESLDALNSVAYQTDGVYGTYVRLLSPGGQVRYRSPNFADHASLPVSLPDEPEETTVSREWEGDPVRTTLRPLVEDGQLGGWLEVSGFEWSLHQELGLLRRTLIGGILLSMLLAVGGGYILARRALRPVSTMTSAANAIRATDLGARLPTQFGVEDELTELAETFNRMIARLQASFDRERRFTDNAAHELLTPLTTMHNTIEIALRRERDAANYQETLRTTLLDVEEMTDTVQGLLQLARLDRHTELPRETISLSELVERHAQRFADRADRQEIEMQLDLDGKACTRASTRHLGEVVANLIDNAVKYTPRGGRVEVRTRHLGDRVELSVRDTGVGFEPSEAERLFDRFYRSDDPSVQAHGGSGLGLAIIKAITETYGGTVRAHSPGPGEGSTFTVSLPKAPCVGRPVASSTA